MVTEPINIIVTERGSRVVRRNIESIGDGAQRAQSGVSLLTRALGALGGALAIREVTRLADSYVNLQNRLRLVTGGSNELRRATNELLAISNRTRSSFVATGEVYARTALATRELGLSQRETLQFTESLNQAVVLSGASAQEAQAGLIQLSQGLASGALRGDELRSVLEQLPLVADVIARSLNVTRGELRELGSQGLISAEVVTRAFREAREELAERFANTIPTISQAMQILTNNTTALLGQFTEAGGIFAALSQAIFTLAGGVNLLSQNLDTVTDIFSLLAAVAIGRFLGPFVTRTAQATVQQVQFVAAVASGNAVLLNGAQAELQRAQAANALAAARRTEAAATVASLQARTNNLRAIIAENQAERANLVGKIELQAGIAGVTGRTEVLTRLRAANTAAIQRETQATRLLTATKAELAAANNTLSAATTRATATQGALQTAMAGTTIAARLTAGALGLMRGALALVGGPAGLFLVAATALFFFNRRTTESVSAVNEHEQALSRLNDELTTNVARTQQSTRALEDRTFAQLRELRAQRTVADGQQRILRRQVRDQQQAVTDLEAAQERRRETTVQTGGILGADVQAAASINRARTRLRELQSALAAAETNSSDLTVAIARLEESFRSMGRNIRERANAALDRWRARISPVRAAQIRLAASTQLVERTLANFNGTTTQRIALSRELNRLLDQERRLLRDQLEPYQAFTRVLDQQNQLLGLSTREQQIQIATRRAIQELTRADARFTEADVRARIQQNIEISAQNELLQRIRRPLETYRNGLQALQAIQGQLSRDQYSRELQRLQREYMRATNPLAVFNQALVRENRLLRLSTEARRIARVLLIAQTQAGRALTAQEREQISSLVAQNLELARQQQLYEGLTSTVGLVENAISNAFSNAESAIARFAQTGRLSFSNLVDGIIGDLARLAARQAILTPLANFLGLGGGGGGFNLVQSLGSLFGLGGAGAGAASAAAAAVGGATPGLAQGGTGLLGGTPGRDRNVLSLNGQPIARVSRGERMTISPGQAVPQPQRERPIQVTMVFQGVTDAQSFIQNENAVRATAARALQTADRRNN